MGARHFIAAADSSADSADLALDLILVSVDEALAWDFYLRQLRADGTLCFLAVPASPASIPVAELVGRRRRVAGSPIAGRPRLGKMLEFCAHHQISPQCEMFPLEAVNDVLAKLAEGRLRYRAVLLAGSQDLA